MRHRMWVLAVVALIGSSVLMRTQARMDEQSLKVAHETLFGGVKTGNLALLQTMIHSRGLGFFRESVRPAQLGAGYGAGDALPAVLADLGRFQSIPTQTVYRVVGQVGVVAMTAQLQAQKGSDQQDRFSRATYVYIVDGANWKLLSWHGSDTPQKK